MYPHAIDIHEFYATPVGRVVLRILKQRLRQFWPDVTGKNIVGMGYALPYLDYFLKESGRMTAIMSPETGAMSWPWQGSVKGGVKKGADGQPPEAKNLVTLAQMDQIPLESSSVDLVMVVHHLEIAENLPDVLQEIWRILEGNGRILLVIPNRTGIWARRDATPFGYGTPFSNKQLRQALREAMFSVERIEHALYLPPTSSRLLLSTAPFWERTGQKICAGLGGVTIVEASKQLFAGMPIDGNKKLWGRRQTMVPKTI